jgi:hypothetical protein
MPYQGKTVGIDEMLNILGSNEQTEAEAAIELERAFEEGAIMLFDPRGRESDPPSWPALSAEQTLAIISILRALCNRTPGTTISRAKLSSIEFFNAVRAVRSQFELAFGLGEAATDITAPRQTAEQACASLILELKKGPRLKKLAVQAKASAAIPDLTEKEFDRAWRSSAGDWATGGRPSKTLN